MHFSSAVSRQRWRKSLAKRHYTKNPICCTRQWCPLIDDVQCLSRLPSVNFLSVGGTRGTRVYAVMSSSELLRLMACSWSQARSKANVYVTRSYNLLLVHDLVLSTLVDTTFSVCPQLPIVRKQAPTRILNNSSQQSPSSWLWWRQSSSKATNLVSSDGIGPARTTKIDKDIGGRVKSCL